MLLADVQHTQLPGLKDIPEDALHRESGGSTRMQNGKQEPTTTQEGLVEEATDLRGAQQPSSSGAAQG